MSYRQRESTPKSTGPCCNYSHWGESFLDSLCLNRKIVAKSPTASNDDLTLATTLARPIIGSNGGRLFFAPNIIPKCQFQGEPNWCLMPHLVPSCGDALSVSYPLGVNLLPILNLFMLNDDLDNASPEHVRIQEFLLKNATFLTKITKMILKVQSGWLGADPVTTLTKYYNYSTTIL